MIPVPRPCGGCESVVERPARFCPSCCGTRGHSFHPHAHPMTGVPSPAGAKPSAVKARPRPCSKRFWCQACGCWLDGPGCGQEAA